MQTVQQVQKKMTACSSTLVHCSVLAQALAQAVEVRFSYLFSFTAESEMFAAAATCHPKFKLRWVPETKKEWVKEALLQEANKLAPASTATVTSECETAGGSPEPKRSCRLRRATVNIVTPGLAAALDKAADTDRHRRVQAAKQYPRIKSDDRAVLYRQCRHAALRQ